MVSPQKMAAAMYAIHCVLVKARWLAGERVEHEKLYQLLDRAEYLPALVMEADKDTSEEFRQALIGLGDEFPECAGLLSNFDGNIAWQTLPRAS